MSTKTWQEEFGEKEFRIYNENTGYYDYFEDIPLCSEIKQFISDLRKKDEEELCKKLRAFQSIIKDYYAK